ncbi:MAG: hypothetical protein J2P48_19485 [Alphaproteobacteria bacterium]|nr:hypothetical protein [Alphaproteobacteria bacterium]
MGSYLVRRFGLMLLALFGISVTISLLLRIAPGNIADILFDTAGFVDPAERATVMEPIPAPYAQRIGGLLLGDPGYSYVSDRHALREILPRIPITAKAHLSGLSMPAFWLRLLFLMAFVGHFSTIAISSDAPSTTGRRRRRPAFRQPSSACVARRP